MHFKVIVIHLDLFIFDPALFDLFFMLLTAFLQVYLSVSLLKYVAENHFGVKSLHLILVIVQFLIGRFYCLQT